MLSTVAAPRVPYTPQFGPRRLWKEITTAYHEWEQLGRPAAESWRFIITPHHEHVELVATARNPSSRAPAPD